MIRYLAQVLAPSVSAGATLVPSMVAVSRPQWAMVIIDAMVYVVVKGVSTNT
jgi:hypothetical protein